MEILIVHKKQKKPALILLVTLAAFALIGRGMATSDSTKLSVAPETSTGAVDDTFSIDIYITNVTNLWGYEFVLRYDTAVLTATLSTPSTDFPDIMINFIDDTAGYVWVAATLPTGVTIGLNGSMTLVTIEFSVDALGESTLDIDEDSVILAPPPPTPPPPTPPPPIPATIVDGYFTTSVVKVHDIAITSVTASPIINNVTTINVNVANEGNFTETFNVTISYDGTVIGTQTVTEALTIGANTTVSFTWNTTSVAAGIYTISAEAIVDEDNDLVNNSDTVTVAIGAVHDIAITSVTAPTKVAPGDLVSINVNVANEGNFTETFNVTISYDGTVIETETDVSLAVGANTTVSFTWNTDGLPEGPYAIRAETIVDEDDDPTNNTQDAGIITIEEEEEAQALNILLYVAMAAGIVLVIVAAVGFYILRVRKPKPT